MRQIWISRPGEPEVLRLREASDPIPRSGEVRVRVAASGIHFNDVLGRLGLFDDAPPYPYVPGAEVAGTVDAIGQGVTDLAEGDEVLALPLFGGYSDVICVPHRQVFKRLTWMSADHGAAMGVAYLTAYVALVVMGSLRPGDRVLIHSAAGGVGLAAVDIGRIVGAELYGTAGPTKHAFLRQRGLHHPIDYHDRDYGAAITELTRGRGVHLIVDSLGGEHWRKNYRLLSPGGRLVHLGLSSLVTGKGPHRLARWRLAWHRLAYAPGQLMHDNRAVIGINLLRLWDQAERMRSWMKQIVDWYDEALFRPHVDRSFPFTEAAAAHHYLQERRNTGKVLLKP